MLDNLPDAAIILLDAEGRVQSWNAGAKRLLGYREADAVGQMYSSIVPHASLASTGEPLSLVMARKKGRHDHICQRMHSDGTDLELREVVIPLRDPKHNLVGFGLMMQSIEAARRAGGVAPDHKTILSAPKPRVLLVDDDLVVRTTTGELLEHMDYDVVEAASGAEALDILTRDESIDVLFTDVVMPGMDGGKLAEQARLIRPGLKVLFTSGYFPHALVQKGTIKPNTNVLVKPYRARELESKLRKILADDIAEKDLHLSGAAPL
jgi:PAS domain S-box-containing protein